MNLLFAIILQVLMNPFSLDEPYQEEQKTEVINEYKIDYSISTQSATDMEWVWCNVCHQHLPEIGGKLYDWDRTTHGVIGLHEHQNGYVEDLPIDSNGTGMYILILLCLVLCFYNMIYDRKRDESIDE